MHVLQPKRRSLQAIHLLVGNREVLACGILVLTADEVGDALVLGLLRGTLVVLGTLLEDVLLDPVDAFGLSLERIKGRWEVVR